MDFANAVLSIFKDNRRLDADKKIIPFREIKTLHKVAEEQEEHLRSIAPSNYSFPFVIGEENGKFTQLYCATAEEREMWYAGFRYLVLSTAEVQKIIDENTKKARQLDEQKTSELLKQGIKKMVRQNSIKTSEPRQGSELEMFKSSAEVLKEERQKKG